MRTLRHHLGGGWGLALAVPIILFIAWPVVRLVIDTVAGTHDGGLNPYEEAFSSPVALSAVWGSIWLTVATLVCGVPLAVFLAWITSSTDAPMGRALAALPTLTLALSPLVGAIGWLILLSPRVGILNLLLRDIFGLDIEVGPLNAFSLPVIVMLMAFYVVPYIYGPVHAAFEQIDASLQEAARACGASSAAILWTVTLPLLRPAILAGALIGGVMSAAMFAIPLILSSGTGLNVIPTQIYHYINQEGRPAPAMAMASLLTVVTMTAMAMYFRILGRGRFVTVAGKGARHARLALGWWKWPASLFVLLYLFLAMILPLLSLLYLSLVGFWSSNVFEQTMNFEQYRKLIDFPSAMAGLYNSTWLAGVGATIALILGFVISYRRLRNPVLLNRVLALLSALPLGIPSIVLGLAFLYTFTGGWLPLYGTPIILVLAYAIHVLPMSMRNCDASLMRMSPELEEAGLVCGDSRLGVVGRILLPSMWQPMIVVWGLTFIILFRDLSISILLFTSATVPSSVAMLTIFDQGWVPGVAAYSIIMTAISGAVVAIMLRSSSKLSQAEAQ